MALTNYLLCISLIAATFPSAWQRMNLTQTKQEMGASDLIAVKIKLVPINIPAPPKGMPYKVAGELRIKLNVTNNSDEVLKALVVDTYYQNRPKLFKNGQPVAYKKGIENLVQAKDEEFTFVRVGSVVEIQPTATAELEELKLDDWYDTLKPGSYKLINRHRFQIDAAWSGYSAPLLFEVIP